MRRRSIPSRLVLMPETPTDSCSFTSDTTTAFSTNIADYNTFVISEANSVLALFDLGATWTVIGSTDSVSAATNIGTTTSGIYTLDGNQVATSTTALFNTAPPIYFHPSTSTKAEMWRIRSYGQVPAPTDRAERETLAVSATFIPMRAHTWEIRPSRPSMGWGGSSQPTNTKEIQTWCTRYHLRSP